MEDLSRVVHAIYA